MASEAGAGKALSLSTGWPERQVHAGGDVVTAGPCGNSSQSVCEVGLLRLVRAFGAASDNVLSSGPGGPFRLAKAYERVLAGSGRECFSGQL